MREKLGVFLVKAWKRNQEVKGGSTQLRAEARTHRSEDAGHLRRQAVPGSWGETMWTCSGKQDAGCR